MTKEEIIEVAEDLFDSNEEPEWEVDLLDQFASVFCDVTAEGKCLVVFANKLNGEIEDAKMFDSEEEAEAHINALQNEAYEPEEEIDV